MNLAIYDYIINKIRNEGIIHSSLFDPDETKQSCDKVEKMAVLSDKAGTDMFFVGGSTCFDHEFINETIKTIKQVSDKPVVIFPGNLNGVSKYADAILFMSVLNSKNQYFLTGQQSIGSYAVKSAGIEPIGTAYLIIEPGCTAGWMADAKPIPRQKPQIAVGYSLAAEYFGFKLIYLEAGSGAEESVPDEMIEMIKKMTSLPLIIGGGINTPESAAKKVKAGADIIVQGTFIEKMVIKDEGNSLKKIITAAKKAGKEKIASNNT